MQKSMDSALQFFHIYNKYEVIAIMKDSNYEAAEEWRGLNNYEKEVMYDGSGDADDVFLFT